MERTSPALFPELLLRQADFVRSLARSLLADPGAAEDVAQDAFAAALAQPPASSGALRVWLARVVRNLVAQRRRGEARRLAREERSARAESIPSVADVLQRESLRAEIVGAVLALREPYRTVILLRFYEGRGPRAIAALLGVPVETVRTRTKTALALLRQRLDRGFGERSNWAALLAPLARGPQPVPLGHLAESLPPLLSALTVMSLQAKLAGAAAGVVLLSLWFLAGRGSAVPRQAEDAGPTSTSEMLQPPLAEAPDLVPAIPGTRAPVASQPATAGAALSTDEGSVRVRVSWFDGTPADGIGVLVQPKWVNGGVTARTCNGVTDETGELRVEGLPPGDALVELDRGDVNAADVVEILPGGEAVVELTLTRGFDVRGVVRNPSGTPVAGADVWASRWDVEEGFVLTRTDAEGRFALRSLTSGYIGARARGFAPSLCQSLLAGEGAALEVELVLMGPGGAVSGTVVDPAGRPVAKAWVAVGLDHPLGPVHMTPVGGARPLQGVLSGPLEARTDAEGRYRIDGLAPGVRRMAVRAAGFGAWRGEVEVVEQRTRIQDVELQPGVTLVGRLTLPDGAPARGSVEIEGELDALSTGANADAEGRFRLEGLEAGELDVRATGRRGLGRARTTLRGAPGETLTWDACLSLGGAIRGRVFDESGAPLARWRVLAQDDPPVRDDHDYAQVETDAEGRFALQGLHDRPHRVEASPPEHLNIPVATVKGIHPEREELVLCIEAAQLPTVHVVGSVVDVLGQPVGDAQLALGKKAGTGLLFYPEPSGDFDIGPLPPGAWALIVSSPSHVDCPRLVLGPRELAPDEVWDCGTIVLAPGGTVFVAAAVGELGADAEPEFRVLREGVFPRPLEREGAGWRSGPLQDGAYRLQVRGRGVAATQLPFEIRNGETTRLEVALHPGPRVEIRVGAPAAGEGAQPTLRITRGDELVLEDQIWLREDAGGYAHPGDYGTEVSLAPGRYRVEAWLEDGPRTAAELQVEAGEPTTLRLAL